jgi:quinohemoprotein ethanol dehydrogenase
MSHRIGLWTAAVAALLAGCIRAPQVIDNAALSSERDGVNWPAYGRTFSEGHYSPLTQISDRNVGRLGLAWALDLDVSNSVTAPLAVNGVIYLGAGHGVIHAVDARSGKLLWRYDARAPEAAGEKLRVAWGIRGLAFWKNRVYAGTTDGRLIALNAADGTLAWSTQTVDPKDGAVISGAPRAFNGKIVIGFGGGDFSPLRGYVTAYDAETGRKIWRFYTVPGAPGTTDHASSDDVMTMAAKTWTGQWWRYGGGGTVWNAMTYDPEFNRLYIGTGNGSPMNWNIRSPDGGDNLFVASVVALDADTGRYVWHYQTTPGDAWDYDSATDMTLATLRIDGQPRKVLLHAAKNGFFYVIDRQNGRLISADKLGTVTWADHVDLTTGKPVLMPGAKYEEQGIVLWPSFLAVHHWPPQSYSPLTGYVYVPTLEMPGEFSNAGVDIKHWDPLIKTPEFTGFAVGSGDIPVNAGHSVLKAWDPIARRIVWQAATPGVSNGGTLATAGGLVFQGLADGYLHAYSAQDGRDLWSFFAGVAVTGVPIIYSVDGREYLTITAGPLGGTTGAYGAISARWGWDARVHPRRLLTFALDADAGLPPTPPRAQAVPLDAPEFQVDPVRAKLGENEYVHCTLCHGMAAVAGGIAPDLRASPVPLSMEEFTRVVRDGALLARGMPRFEEMSDAQLESLRQYLRQKARTDLATQSQAAPH